MTKTTGLLRDLNLKPGDYHLCTTLDCDELDTLIQHLQDIRDAL